MAGGAHEDLTTLGFQLAKIDESRSTQWNETYAQSGFECAARAVQQTVDGGYMVAGLARSMDFSLVNAWLSRINTITKK